MIFVLLLIILIARILSSFISTSSLYSFMCIIGIINQRLVLLILWHMINSSFFLGS